MGNITINTCKTSSSVDRTTYACCNGDVTFFGGCSGGGQKVTNGNAWVQKMKCFTYGWTNSDIVKDNVKFKIITNSCYKSAFCENWCVESSKTLWTYQSAGGPLERITPNIIKKNNNEETIIPISHINTNRWEVGYNTNLNNFFIPFHFIKIDTSKTIDYFTGSKDIIDISYLGILQPYTKSVTMLSTIVSNILLDLNPVDNYFEQHSLLIRKFTLSYLYHMNNNKKFINGIEKIDAIMAIKKDNNIVDNRDFIYFFYEDTYSNFKPINKYYNKLLNYINALYVIIKKMLLKKI